MHARPHPGPPCPATAAIPQEREKNLPRFGAAEAPDRHAVPSANNPKAATAREAFEMTMDVPRHSLSPGERARVRASVKTILCSTFLFCLAFTSPLLADDVITNVMSPIVSFQYPDNFSSQALTNGGIAHPSSATSISSGPAMTCCNCKAACE